MNDASEKSLTEQIYAEFLSEIGQLGEFDADALLSIKELAARGELKKPKSVSAAILPKVKKQDETA